MTKKERKILEDAGLLYREGDLVLVVRCGECRNYDPYTSGLSLGRGWCDALDTEVDDGFFCADGERREDEEERGV